jgi:Na+-driven multidrug efflux pump
MQRLLYPFTTDPKVIAETPDALRWVFAASPIIAIQLIGAAYSGGGNAKKALLLTLVSRAFLKLVLLPNFSVFLESGSPSLLQMYCQLY